MSKSGLFVDYYLFIIIYEIELCIHFTLYIEGGD